MKNFSIIDTPISGLKIVERKSLLDSRGKLSRIFCSDQLREAGWLKPVLQINESVTKKCGTIRGLHLQCTPNTEMKLVSCLQGEVWDVAIDLRKNSPTFLHMYADSLSSENCRALLIPEGFAHGYQTLTDDCQLLYLHSAVYAPESEFGLHPNDPTLGISWPLEVCEISMRDASHPFLTSEFKGIEL